MGRIFKFDKDVDTDQIIASQYLLFPTIDEIDRKSTRLNSSHVKRSRMPSSA